MYIVITILATLLITRLLSWMLRWVADWDSDDGFTDWLACYAWSLCDTLNIAHIKHEPDAVDGLDRHEQLTSEPFFSITQIVVPDEYSRTQLIAALRYIHDMHIDTDYVAVNYLMHLYLPETSHQIVIQDPDEPTAEERIENAVTVASETCSSFGLRLSRIWSALGKDFGDSDELDEMLRREYSEK